MSWYDPSEAEDDLQFDEFVQSERRKLERQPAPEPIEFGIPDVLDGIGSPPFDDTNYIKRCEASWRAEFKQALEWSRKRWLAIIGACLAGEYGRTVREDWQASYPGVNPETLHNKPLMEAAQCVWVLKGSKCVEKMPELKTWD